MTRMTRLYEILKVVSATLFALVFAACEPDFDFNTEFEHGRIPDEDRPAGVRQPNEESRNLLLLYSAGFNNLSSYLSQDIEDLKMGSSQNMNRFWTACENTQAARHRFLNFPEAIPS